MCGFCFPGTKITVRCLKLLKPYQKKELMVEEDDDENEDGVGVSRKGLPQQDIIMERDLVLQAYHIGAYDCSSH
jgi:hypothetical protein